MRDSPAPELRVYPDREILDREAAEACVNIGNAAIAEGGGFSVVLSGGSTPRQMYEQLAADELRSRLDWKRVYFFWGDERAVPPDDPQSNYRMADKTLLSRVPVPRENVYRIPAEKPPQVAAMEYEQLLRRFLGSRRRGFDLVLLGLGTNGHTASLFPRTPALEEKSRWCVPVWVPELNEYRITLTAPILNHAANVFFLVVGGDKAAILDQVLNGPYDPERLPAQLIRPDEGKFVWLVDQAAASKLKSKQQNVKSGR